jgi:quercetin dioxygenase-like cupin family protein
MIITGKAKAVRALDLHDGKTVFHVKKRVLIGPDQGAEEFVMRLFTLSQGGATPYHTHPWEHEVYVISGKGKVRSVDGEVDVEAGDFVYVPADDEHQFANAAADPFEFLCVVPLRGEG